MSLHFAMFVVPFFVVISLFTLQGVSSTHHNLVKSMRWQDLRPNLPQCIPDYIVTPQYNPSGSFFTNVPAVTIFNNAFLKAVYTTDILREAFDLSKTTAKQYADFVREFTPPALAAVGVQNPVEVTEFESRGIEQSFDVITLPVVARVFANTVAHFFFVENFLTVENAERLACAYAESIINSAKECLNEDPMSKFRAIDTGYTKFLISVGMFEKEKAARVTYYAGNEWFVAGVNYRWL